MFETEEKVYLKNKEEWLKDPDKKDKYVLIKGRKVYGFFSTRDLAAEKAVEQKLEMPVYIHHVVAKEPVVILGGAGLHVRFKKEY